MFRRGKKDRSAVAVALDEQLSSLGRLEKSSAKYAIEKACDEIGDDEHIGAAVPCISGGMAGIAIATDHRLVIVTGTKKKYNVEEFAYSRIQSVEADQGVVFNSLVIHGAENKAELRNVPKKVLPGFHHWLRDRIKAEREAAHAGAGAGISQADELAKFAQLRAQGVISEDEFEAKKKQILGL